jgi:hypothetical protein
LNLCFFAQILSNREPKRFRQGLEIPTESVVY